MKPFAVKSDFEKDFKNWMQAIKKGQSHGISWISHMPSELRIQIQDKSNEEIEEIIKNFLKEKYAFEGKNLENYAKHLEEVLNNIGDKIFFILEKIIEKPMYRDNFTGFITTLFRAPYFTPSGYIWFIYDKKDDWQIRACIHEMFHMQFEFYYRENIEKQIGKEKFAFLRESMTVILNDEMKGITSEIDKGYPLHQEFRAHLLELWRKKKNFSEFLENAVRDINKI